MSLGVHTKCLVPNFVTGELLYVLMNKNWPDKVNTPHGWAIVFWQSSLSPSTGVVPLGSHWLSSDSPGEGLNRAVMVCLRGEPIVRGFIANLLKS